MSAEIELDRRRRRRQFLAMVARRQRPGAGSTLAVLDVRTVIVPWWKDANEALRGVTHAVGGAVAANAYAPERSTRDIDFLVVTADFERASGLLRAAGWEERGLLAGVRGSSWRDVEGHELDLIAAPEPWGKEAIETAQQNVVQGMPTLTLPYIVWMKLFAARTIDLADVSRMLGRAGREEVAAARALVARLGGREDVADFDQLVQMGRLERAESGDGVDLTS